MCPSVASLFCADTMTDSSAGCRDGFILLDDSLNDARIGSGGNGNDNGNVFSSTTTTTTPSLVGTPFHLRSYIKLPIFVLLAFTTWVFGLVFVTFSIGSGDFCVDSPDPPILALSEQRLAPPLMTTAGTGSAATNSGTTASSETLIYDFMEYHLQDCPAILTAKEKMDNMTDASINQMREQSAPADIDQRIRYISQGLVPAIEQVLSSIEQVGVNVIQQHCEGRTGSSTSSSSSNLNTLLLVMPTLQKKYCELAQSLVRLKKTKMGRLHGVRSDPQHQKPFQIRYG